MPHNPCKQIIIYLLLSLVSTFPAFAADAPQESIVKIFTTIRTYSYQEPWQAAGFEDLTGSGCLIAGRQILTNAHVVSNAAYIEVQRNNDPAKYPAEVVAIAHEVDLALLRVKDAKAFVGIEPLALGPLPELLDNVAVYGFPEGGQGLSITKGIVSRIEETQYAQSGLDFLAVQIDAAINGGNSGGPVIKDGKIVGVAMQTMTEAQNIGYLIPTPIIEHVLADLRDGHYDGFPDVGVYTQALYNHTLRAVIGLPESESGVYINEVSPGSAAAGKLLAGDVILAVDGTTVANDGTVLMRPGLRISADSLLAAHQVGDTATVTVWRQKRRIDIPLQLSSKCGDTSLVKSQEYDTEPEYYILNGLVLMPLSVNYLMSWGEKWQTEAPVSLLKYFEQSRGQAGEQVVFIGGVLKSEENSGYGTEVVNVRVVEINNQKITSFKEFAKRLDEALKTEKPLLLKNEDNTIIAVSPAEHRASEKKTQEQYGVERHRRLGM